MYYNYFIFDYIFHTVLFVSVYWMFHLPEEEKKKCSFREHSCTYSIQLQLVMLSVCMEHPYLEMLWVCIMQINNNRHTFLYLE